MIHAKQWHYSLQQRLPEASFHSFYTKNPRNSSSTNSTSRRQRALRLILHTEGKEIFYPVYKDLAIPGIPAARPSTGIPVSRTFQTFQSFMTFQPSGIPVPHSSTNQYLPVLSSTIQGFHPFQHFFN